MSPFALGYDPDVNAWTLDEVVGRGALVFECVGCLRLAVMETDKLADRFGSSARVAAVRSRMYCRRCGATYPRSLVRLNFGRKDLAWWPMPPRAGR